VDGEAVLDVALPAATPSTAWLAPCSLAVSEATWLGEHPQPAVLAVGEDGRLGIRAPRSGQLQWKWSLRGRQSTTGSVEFLVELPTCPSNRLLLVLPKQLTPLVERAVVAKEGSAGDAAERWRIELGGQHRCQLRLVPSEVLDPARRLNTLRQTLAYEFSLRGVELSAQWTLDVPGVPLRQVAVDLDPSLQLVATRYGGLPVAWSAVGTAGPGGSNRVVFELPEPIQGSGRVLRLGAIAPVVLGSRWRLPAIRPQGLFWQEGTATLIVPSPLTLEHLAVEGGRQTQTGPLPAPRSGQLAEFQCFSPNAAIEVVLAKPESPPEFDCGTALELSGVDMAAEATAAFRLAEGEQFEIEGDVSRLWTVDSVETVPANALEDWALLQGEAGNTRLSIRLAKALCAARPLKVVVQARHHYSPLGRILFRDDLAPIEFHGSGGGRRLVSIRAAEAYQLRLAGAERLTRLDPQNLTPADLELFDDRPKGLVFVSDAQADGVRIALEPQKPSYSAALQVEATATDAGVSESYAIRCVPEAARVDRLLVQFSQSRSVPLRWSLGSEEQDQVTVRPWEPGGHPAGSRAARGESFEITFRRPRSVPFEIRAVRTLSPAGPVSICLASLPEAAAQSGTVSIGSTRTGAMQIEARHVTPMPADPTPGDQYSTVRAVYRYNPTRDVGPASETAVVLIPQEKELATPWAWAWTCHVESRYETGGAAYHAITYHLQNAGRNRILFALPEELNRDAIRGVWVDGAKVPWEVNPDGSGDWLAIPLPPGRKFPVVSLQLATAGASLGVVDSLEPVLPQLDVPVLQCHWTVWLPPGYQSAVPGLPGESPWAAAKTVAQRWFGPLGRPEQASRFHPWTPNDWAQWGGSWSEPALARRNAELFLDRLGTFDQPPPPAAEGTNPSATSAGAVWAEQLTRAAAGLEPAVLVDRVALARAGIRCRGPVPKVSGETAADRGLAVAQQAGLALLISNDMVLLTGAVDAALHHAYLAPAGPDTAWHVLPGPLADRLALAAESGQDPILVPLEIWSRLPDPCGDPWTRPPEAGQGPTETLGWSAYRLELPAERVVVLPIVHRDSLRGLGWSMFLGIFAILAWKGRQRPTLLVSLAGLSALAALLVPEALAPFPSSALWAALAAVALRWVMRRQRAVPGRADSTVTTQRRVAMAAAVRAGIVVWAAASAYAWCSAARGEPAAAPPPGAAYQVLIPVDDKQQPSGDKYYVPESLFSQLQAAAAGRSDDPRGWVLQSAVYRGALSWRTAPEQLALEEIRATLDIEVFGRQVRVRMPIGRVGLDPLPDGVTLEGRSIQPVWPDAEGNLSFDIAEPGRYRLELAAKPTAQVVGDKSVVQWKIPRLATSRLELTIPPDAPNIEFPSALGAIVREPDPSRLLVALGPTDQLQIAWPEGASPSGAGVAVDAEQLLWLKVRPDSVVLETLLSLKVIEGRIREVQLAIDPRLRYFPSKTERSPIADVSTVPGEPQWLRFRLSQPASDKLVIPATFLLQESCGLGNYRLPWVEVLNVRTTKRWLAVSVDPPLEHSQAGGERLHAVAVPTFVASWGAVKSPPLAAWELSSPRPDWSVSTRPAPARTAAEQTLTLSFAARSAHVLLKANVTHSGEAVFQHRIVAPPKLEIERISVRQEGVERVSRWSRAADGATTVFLNGPSAGNQQLTLQGRLPTPEQGNLALPMIRLEAEAAKPIQIAVFREPAVQVWVGDLVGLAETEPPPVDESRAPLGRLVKAFRVQQAGAVSAGVRIAPNRPKIRAEQITWIRSVSDTWQTDVEFRFKVSGGLADYFRLDVPPHWNGPYKVHPPATFKVVDVPGKPHRQLVVRPRAAIEGDYRLSISSPLKLGASERPAAAKIIPEEVAVTKHLVILPVGPQVPAASWETHGLVETKLPEDVPVPPADRAAFTAYRAVGEDYQALLRLGDQGQGKPQVSLADLRIAWQVDGSFHASAAFDLEPAGLASCPVTLPPECRLVQVLAAGQSTVAVPAGENQWQVPLGSPTLPQRIEVLFVGQVPQPGNAGLLDFAMPALGEIPVRQSIWSVSAPGGYRLRAGDPLDSLTPLQHALAGLRSLTAIVERVADLADLPGVEPEPLVRWYRDWAGRWLTGRTSVVRQLVWVEAESEAASVRAELESLEKRQATASEQLGLAELLAQVAAEPVPREDLGAIWLSTEEARRAVIRHGTATLPDPVAVAYEEDRGSGTAERLAAALTVAVLGVAAAWGTRRGVLPKLLLRWPYGAGAVIGLAWWWWLAPSVLGCGLTLACLAAAAWSHRRQRRKSASMVVLASQ
jgi:hypothetical protein